MKHLQTINKKAIISNIFEGYGENFSTIDGREASVGNEGDNNYPEYHLTLTQEQVDINFKEDLDSLLYWLITKEYFNCVEDI